MVEQGAAMDCPGFPPLYEPVAVAPGIDAFEEAVRLARAGAAPGTLVWSRDEGRAACAVVLAPELPLNAARPVLFAGALGLGDALGALAPPQVAVTFACPGIIEVNGARAGEVRLAAPSSDEARVPDWLVLGIEVAVAHDDAAGEPGLEPDRTCLHEEGCGEIGAVRLIEAFARHALIWLGQFEERGFGPIRAAWQSRARALGQLVTVEHAGAPVTGIFKRLTDDGDLLLEVDGQAQTIPLAGALEGRP